jgi:hypothetical protein
MRLAMCVWRCATHFKATCALWAASMLTFLITENLDPLPAAQEGEHDLIVVEPAEHDLLVICRQNEPQLPVRRRNDASRLDHAVPHASVL